MLVHSSKMAYLRFLNLQAFIPAIMFGWMKNKKKGEKKKTKTKKAQPKKGAITFAWKDLFQLVCLKMNEYLRFQFRLNQQRNQNRHQLKV